MTFFLVLAIIGLIVTLGILFAGIIVMGRGGEVNRKWGNKLMRARVISQFMVVVFLALLAFVASK